MEAASAVQPGVTRRKALGAFYTPRAMADKMLEWAVRTPADRALDPSFGGLVFLEAAKARLTALGTPIDSSGKQLFGCDLDEDAHASALAHDSLGLPDAALLHQDFFTVIPNGVLPLVDAVVGNPPYVRYQLNNVSADNGRQVAMNAGLKLSRLASSWAPFVLHSAEFVAPGGRLALVLPAELMHAQYAGDVLNWIQRRFARTAIVVFENRVFPGALEEVVLLFAEGRGEGTSTSVGFVGCEDLADFRVDTLRERLASPPAGRLGRGKLLAQLLPSATRDLYERLADDERTSVLGSHASVDIGAVTGANDFFLLKDGDEPGLAPELLRPTVSKAVQVQGTRFTEADFALLKSGAARCLMFTTSKETSAEALATAEAYLARGERESIDERYKCRVRKPWYSVPLPKQATPDLFLTYCSAEFPRIVVNEAQALHTNTLHGVRLLSDSIKPDAFATTFYNSLTLLSAELVGRSYGGGVLKLEPTEAEALLLPPVPADAAPLTLEVDELLRARKLHDALELVDKITLIDGLGLGSEDVSRLRAGAERLRARRRARNKPPKTN